MQRINKQFIAGSNRLKRKFIKEFYSVQTGWYMPAWTTNKWRSDNIANGSSWTQPLRDLKIGDIIKNITVYMVSDAVTYTITMYLYKTERNATADTLVDSKVMTKNSDNSKDFDEEVEDNHYYYMVFSVVRDGTYCYFYPLKMKFEREYELW